MPLVIEGMYRLEGETTVAGAKNAALPIIAATLLTSDECLLENVPNIEDIRNMVRLLHRLGVPARFEGPSSLRIKAMRISDAELPLDLASVMRASFLSVGPLLSRFGQARAPHPGGCAIGTRPVSVDLKGFQAMGGQIEYDEETYVISAPRLAGETLILDYPSHTGTENLMMAATLANGTTRIENASVEPEVCDLASFLCAMGARIKGAGTNCIEIEGVRRLHGAAFRVMPDRMEAGTLALAALITGGSVSMEGAVSRWLGALTAKMREIGADVEATSDVYRASAPKPLVSADIQTFPYPGFPTDLQAPFATAMTQAEGNASIYETMYDGRLRYAEELRLMGAQIDVSASGRMAMVHGPTHLRGAEVCALDIRSGAAMILAGLAAEGNTRIGNLRYIDRGYEDVAHKLKVIGAKVWREDEDEPVCPDTECGEPLDWDTRLTQ